MPVFNHLQFFLMTMLFILSPTAVQAEEFRVNRTEIQLSEKVRSAQTLLSIRLASPDLFTVNIFLINVKITIEILLR